MNAEFAIDNSPPGPFEAEAEQAQMAARGGAAAQPPGPEEEVEASHSGASSSEAPGPDEDGGNDGQAAADRQEVPGPSDDDGSSHADSASSGGHDDPPGPQDGPQEDDGTQVQASDGAQSEPPGPDAGDDAGHRAEGNIDFSMPPEPSESDDDPAADMSLGDLSALYGHPAPDESDYQEKPKKPARKKPKKKSAS